MSTHNMVVELMAGEELGTLWTEAGVEERSKSSAGGRRGGVPPKRLGEIAEAAFLAKVAELGFGISKPWGDSDPYDFIVHAGERLWRALKSSHRIGRDGMYSFRTQGYALRAYRADQIDLLVAFVVPEQAWYVIPVRVAKRLRSLKLCPGSRRRRSKFERYREAWGVLESGIKRRR